MVRREAAPLACTLSLLLLAASAAPGLAQTEAQKAPAAPTTGAATATVAPSKAAATTAQGTSTKTATTTTAAATPKSPATTAQGTSTKTATATAAAATPKSPATATGAATTTSAAATPKSPAAKKTVASATRADSASAAAAGTASPARRKTGARAAAAADSAQGEDRLRGGQEGTVFKSLTVEGEDRVHIDFERPELDLDLDLEKAPGLDWGSAADVLNRTSSDLQTPLVGLSAKQAPVYLGHPWLGEFATGPIARFHPDAQGVERWKLVVVDSKGAPVRTFNGKGDPPREIDWDGRASSGSPVTPGLTYSYVFEAYDKAGNKKNVVGQGFTVTAYRIDAPEGPTLLFSASELRSAAGASLAPAAAGGSETPAAPPILLEAASWLNQSEPSRPIKVTATARSQEQADALAENVKRALAPLVLGDPARLDAVALVVPDSPEAGTLAIAPAK